MEACFTDTPGYSGYVKVPNNVPLDERNPSAAQLTPADRHWLAKTRELNWSEIDGPDPYWLNRINWHSIYKGMRPYPERAGEQPGADWNDD